MAENKRTYNDRLNTKPKHLLTRRQILKAGAAAAGAGLISASLPDYFVDALAAPSLPCARLQDIEHVVIFIQENRSFDHYFGSYHGVHGFRDPQAIKQPNGLPVFDQPDPSNTDNPPVKLLLPFHLDTRKTNAACTHDITHDWFPQHRSWNNGQMDGFVTSRLPIDSNDAVLTMGYYNRGDLPFYYAVADAFTICDAYHCSVIGPTDPNRLYTLSATVDPDGKNGGPLLETLVNNRQTFFGRFTWTTMPEQLGQRGISWKVYSPPDSNLENNVLWYFKKYQDPASQLYQNAFVPTYPGTFMSDAAAGNLPQVSWVLAPLVDSEHPPAPSLFGENDLSTILQSIMLNPSLWKKTVIFATYDENGGFFDHVPPPTPPPATPGEYVTAAPVPNPGVLGNPPIYGPVGLGFRVPMLIISPFSRGGFVCSDRFDHTSVLQFLETRFGAEVPNLSAWRRETVGDLTSAFNFTGPNYTVPTLPATLPPDEKTLQECIVTLAGTTPYQVPKPQTRAPRRREFHAGQAGHAWPKFMEKDQSSPRPPSGSISISDRTEPVVFRIMIASATWPSIPPRFSPSRAAAQTTPGVRRLTVKRRCSTDGRPDTRLRHVSVI